MGSQEVVTTEKRVRDILSDDCALDEVGGSEHLGEDRGLDSLDLAEFYMRLEDEFDMGFPEEDWDGLLTIQEIVAYIEKKKAQ